MDLSRMQAGESGTARLRPTRRRRPAMAWVAAAAAVLVVAAGAAAWRWRGDPLAQIARAAEGRRPVEARLTGFSWAPAILPPPASKRAGTERGAEPGPGTESGPDADASGEEGRALEARARLARLRDVAPSPEALQASGLAELLLHHPGAAVRFLERARALAPGDARILSDLAGAYLARAATADDAEDRVRALDAARHAVSLAPDLPAARFNLALARERQRIGFFRTSIPEAGDVVRAWNDFLGLEPDSAWAGEARDHVRLLEAATAGSSATPDSDAVERAAREREEDRVRHDVALLPRVGREVLEKRLLPEWAAAALRRDGDAAASALAPARLVAEALLLATHDRTAVDTVDRIESLRPGSPGSIDLARALRDYGEGIRLHDEDHLAQALGRFQAAEAGMARARVPLRRSAALYTAICEYYEGRTARSEAIVRDIDAALASDDRPSARARVRSMLGLLLAVRGRLGDSLDAYESSLALYAEAGEGDGMARTHFLIAENLEILGDRADAWRHREQAIAFARRIQESRRRAVYVEASVAAWRQDLPWAGLVLIEPAFDGSDRLLPADRVELLMMRGRLRESSGDRPGAAADLEEAGAAMPGIEDPGLRERFAAELALARSDLAGQEPADLAGLEESLRAFEARNSETRVPDIELALGRRLEAAGRASEAAAHYENGLAVTERQRGRLRAEGQQISALERTRELDDAMIRLQAGTLADPGRALEYAERARRRELDLPAPAGAATGSETMATLLQARAGTAILCFVLLDDRTLLWAGTAAGPVFRPGPVGLAAMEEMVGDLHAAAAERDDERFREVAARLYDVLVLPVEDQLPDGGELRIVPDRCLADVPFAALYDRRHGQYLVERYAVAVAPSLALADRSDRLAGRGAGGLLVIADPAFDEARFQGLARLPAAAEEGRAIAAAHPAALLLAGDDATPARFLDGARKAGVLHIAAHSFVNDREPLSSALLLAPGPGRSGLLTVGDLRAAALSETRLVVLGACSAVRGSRARSAGSLSLARPFLLAGVPEIVGPLWDLRDREAASMLTAFQDGIDRGRTPLLGLCEAQRAALRSADPVLRSPISWGGLVLNSTLRD